MIGVVGEVFLGAALVAVALAWASLITRVRRGQRVLPREPRREVPWGILDVVASFLLLLTCQIAAAGWWGDAGEDGIGTAQAQAALLGFSGASSLAILASMLLLHWRTGSTWHDLGLLPTRIAHDIVVGWSAFLLVGPIVYAVQAVLVTAFKYESRHPLIELVQQDDSRTLFAIVAFMAVVVAPVSEEYFFRVLLQGWLEKVAALLADRNMQSLSQDGWTAIASDALERAPEHPTEPFPQRPEAPGGRIWRVLPIAISAGIFAWMHAPHGPDPIPLFVLAVGLGYVYQSTHRLLPCVVLHMCLNGTTMWLVWLGLQL